ncbi:TPA: RNA-binding protein [bacterium]|nr:RNA-binding protein [bacterium]
MNIYVGNLSFDVGEDDLREAFEGFGQVASASIIKDKFSGRSRGFGFVDMPNKEEGEAAINGLNGEEFKGRRLKVNEAHSPSGRRNMGGGRDDRRGGGGRRPPRRFS